MYSSQSCDLNCMLENWPECSAIRVTKDIDETVLNIHIYFVLRKKCDLNSIKLFYQIVIALGKNMLLFVYVTVYF